MRIELGMSRYFRLATGALNRARLGPQIVQFDIYQQAEPKRLHEVKDESLFSIQATQTKKIAIREVKDGPDVQRHAAPRRFESQYPLVGTARQRGPQRRRRSRGP